METTLYIPPLGLAGQFGTPAAGSEAAVVFAHGTSSGRTSPRNVRVAARLREAPKPDPASVPGPAGDPLAPPAP